MPAGEAGGEEGGGEESALLAAPPGSRNAPRLTPGAKGKVYHPVKVDKRSAGARSRSYAAKHSKEKSSSTLRNTMPGYGDLRTLTRMDGVSTGIYEQEGPIYSGAEETEEEKIFSINESVRNLILDLESNKKEEVEQKNENST